MRSTARGDGRNSLLSIEKAFSDAFQDLILRPRNSGADESPHGPGAGAAKRHRPLQPQTSIHASLGKSGSLKERHNGLEPVATPDWQDTTLWQWLKERGAPAEPTRSCVADWLPDIQLLLAKGGTAPLDFTLHDDGHSFRVAERMAQLIPNTTAQQLSAFEVGLLLEASYLHDIGMNPRRPVVNRIRDFLLTGTPDTELKNEMAELQHWLDEYHPGVQPPIEPDRSVPARTASADLLTTHFCRYRHNDWSAEYIATYSKSKTRQAYPTWVEDLTALCRSHHYGFEELMQPEFDLRIVGSGNALVNLRYLAAVLRLADVLEFDPDRTPAVVLQQRNVSPGSQIYWYKDHDIALAI